VGPMGTPVGGPVAVDQVVRFEIDILNDGGLTIDPLVLRDDYDFDCLRSRRAEVEPDAHGGSAGFLQWNNLGALAPGENRTLWVEFTPVAACDETTNRATVSTGGIAFSGETTLTIRDSIGRASGFVFHDEAGSGDYHHGLEGVEGARVRTEGAAYIAGASGPAAYVTSEGLIYTTNTSCWYSFNLLEPGTYQIDSQPPEGSWWTPTGSSSCDAEISTTWDEATCHFGYWWGLDWPPAAAGLGDADVATAAPATEQMTFTPLQDTCIVEWEPWNHGAEVHLRVRQPGLASMLLQFDMTGLPEGAVVQWAKLRLYTPFASNSNRLYLTAYLLDRSWAEGEATWLEAAAGQPWDEPGAAGDHGPAVGWGWVEAPGFVEIDLDVGTLMGWLGDDGFLVRGEGSWNREMEGWFFSREWPNAELQPQLIAGYTVP